MKVRLTPQILKKVKDLRQYRIILSADTASEVRQLPERCLSRKAGIVRCCLNIQNCARQRTPITPDF